MGDTTSQIPQFSDPFSAAAAQQALPSTQPGLLGVSPSTWQSIAQLGAGMIQGANQRTADGHLAGGTGFAPGLAGGVQGFFGDQQRQTAMRSQLAQQAAQTQGTNIENLTKLAGLPLTMARNRFATQALSDPNFLSGPLSGGNQQQGGGYGGAAAGGGSSGPTDYALAVIQEEGTGKNPNSTAQGYGQFTDPAMADYVKAHADKFSSMTPDQISAVRTGNLPIMQDAVNWLAQRNAPILAGAGAPVTGQTLAMAHHLGAGPAAAVYQASQTNPQMPIAQALARSLPAPAAGAYLKANPDLQNTTAGAFAARYAGVPNLGAGGGQAGTSAGPETGTLPAGMSPEEAMQRAEQAQQRAVRLQMAGFDATPATQAAQNYQKYAQDYWLQQSKPQSIRGEGGGVITPGGAYQSPVVRKVLGPDNREWQITQNTIETGRPYQRPSGVPSWAPEGTLSAVPSDLSPGEKTGQTDASADAFGEKSRAQYASSVGTIRAMEDMQRQFQVLNSQPGWYNTGSGAQWKLDLAKAVNTAAQSAGGQPWFDPNKIAAGEDLVKQTKLAGMQTLSSMFGGSKEAASIVTSTQGAVPNIENTPQGGLLVMNGIKEAARWQADQHAFMANWYQTHKGNMIGADVAFNQSRPSPMYTRRGISIVQPYEVSGPQDFKRYLPGTRVIFKGGDPRNIRVVPGSEDVTFQDQGAQ